jgi:hypothetical protein
MLKVAVASAFLVIVTSLSSMGVGKAGPKTDTRQVMAAAGVQMTLAAIAYADDSGNLEQIGAAIRRELEKTRYATKGQWRLAWGPAIRGGNLVYIVQDRERPQRYSVVIRGTDFDLLTDDIEDLWVTQAPYPYAVNASSQPRVSRGALAGLHHIQRMKDVPTGRSLEDFLKDVTRRAEIELLITGHSLGGGLASLVLLWLHDTLPHWDIPITNVHLSGYTFAGPTVGNVDFADYFNAEVGNSFYRFANPLDIVPRSYSDLSSVIAEEVPSKVPLKYRLVLDALRGYLAAEGLKFRQVDAEVLLESVKLPPATPYLTQVIEQHRPNSYLYLLGAPQLDVGKTSALSLFKD